jgi:gas vesicle protein
MMNKDTKKYAVGAAIAGAVGYLAGILTAPKSGKETRDDVKNTAVKAKRDAEKELKQLHNEVNKYIDKAKNFGGKLKDEHKPEFDKAVDKAVSAKEKAREMLTALHDGDAEDKDLKKAIKDVNEAVGHLKSFIEK